MTTTPTMLGDPFEPPNAPRRLVEVALSATLAASSKRKRVAVELMAVPTLSTTEETREPSYEDGGSVTATV